MSAEPLKRTPLYESHKKLGAKFVPFAGWEMPVQYSSVADEHRAVRVDAGIFDVSHMGEIEVTGPEAEAALNYMTSNDVAKMSDGRALYTAITNHDGGTVDDIIIYRYSQERYFLCVNAANTDKDFNWFQKHNKHNAKFVDVSKEWAQIAVQGPKALRIFRHILPGQPFFDLKRFRFEERELLGTTMIIATTGYTGEQGVEIFVRPDAAARLWELLIDAGKNEGLMPVGLGARDSLRLEVCYPLHGHELKDDISVIESGLAWIVKLKKGDFIGRDVLERHSKDGAPRSLVGFYVDDLGVVRDGAKAWNREGDEIGYVTSGTKTPTLNRSLGLALVKSDYSPITTRFWSEMRTKRLRCHVAERPFYRKVLH